MDKEFCWKVAPTGFEGTAKIVPEKVSIIEKENYTGETDKFFDEEINALKFALECQNNVVHDLTGSFEGEEDLNKQIMLLGTLSAVSCMNLSKIKGKENLAKMEIWVEFFNKAIATALGNIDTKDMDSFTDVTNANEIKTYLMQWVIAYLSRFCKSMPPIETQKYVAELIKDAVEKSYNAIIEGNIKNELAQQGA